MSFLNYLIQVSGCLAAFYLLYFCLLRKESFSNWNRFYLLFGAIASILLPMIGQSLLLSVGQNIETIIVYAPNNLSNIINPLPQLIESNKSLFAFFTIENTLLLTYGIGVSVLIIKLILNIGKVVYKIKQGTVQQKEGYYLVKQEQGPICSFLNFVFWSEETDLSSSEQQQILAHELRHVKDRHTLDILFLELLTILLWFNPLIYFYKKEIKNIHEYIADSFVFYDLNYRIRYAELLVKEAALPLKSSPVTHHFFNSLTKNRLLMLNTTSNSTRKLKLLAVLPLLLFLTLVFGINDSLSAQTKSKSQPIYVSSDGDSDLHLKPDGTRRTNKEIVAHVVEEQRKKGNVIENDDVVLVSSKELMDMVNPPAAPKVKAAEAGRYRLSWTGINNNTIQDMTNPVHHKIGFLDMKKRKQIKLKSFTVMVREAGDLGESFAPTYVDTRISQTNSNHLPVAIIERLKKGDKVISLSFSNITFLEDGKEVMLTKPFKFTLK